MMVFRRAKNGCSVNKVKKTPFLVFSLLITTALGLVKLLAFEGAM